jgi:hypothetical protein
MAVICMLLWFLQSTGLKVTSGCWCSVLMPYGLHTDRSTYGVISAWQTINANVSHEIFHCTVATWGTDFPFNPFQWWFVTQTLSGQSITFWLHRNPFPYFAGLSNTNMFPNIQSILSLPRYHNKQISVSFRQYRWGSPFFSPVRYRAPIGFEGSGTIKPFGIEMNFQHIFWIYVLRGTVLTVSFHRAVFEL